MIAVASLLVLAAFWPTLESFRDVWARYNYSHGYLTALVVLWLLWRRRTALLEPDDLGRGVALAALAGLSLLWLVAVVTNLQVVHQGLLPLIVVAWAGALAGWRGARRMLPVAAIFLFVVPFWEVFIPPLQALTIAVTGTAARLAGLEATISGEIITIPQGAFRVAGTCAGIGFFTVGLLLGTLYAHLFLESWRTRLGAIAAAGLLAVVSNWIRVTGLVFVGHWSGMQSDLLSDHGTYGWMVFVATFLLFIPIVRSLERREEARRAEASDGGEGRAGEEDRADGAAEAGAVAGDTDGDGAGWRWALRRVAVAGPLVLAGPLLYLGVGALPVAASVEDADPAAPDLGRPGWTALPAEHERPFDWRPDLPGADTVEATAWTNDTVVVHRDRVLYAEQEQGAELAGSRIASGDALIDERTLWLRDQDRWVRQAIVRDSDGLVLVWYWYRVGGVEAVSEGWAKALELWGFFRRRPDAELVAVSTLCREEGCPGAVEGLRGFLRTE